MCGGQALVDACERLDCDQRAGTIACVSLPCACLGSELEDSIDDVLVLSQRLDRLRSRAVRLLHDGVDLVGVESALVDALRRLLSLGGLGGGSGGSSAGNGAQSLSSLLRSELRSGGSLSLSLGAAKRSRQREA